MLQEKQQDLDTRVREVYGTMAQQSMNRMQAAFALFGASFFGAAASGQPALLLGMLPAAASLGGNFFNWLNVRDRNYVGALRYNTIKEEDTTRIVVSIFGRSLEYDLNEARSQSELSTVEKQVEGFLQALEKYVGAVDSLNSKEGIQDSKDIGKDTKDIGNMFQDHKEMLIGHYLDMQELSLHDITDILGDYELLFGPQQADNQKGIGKSIGRFFIGQSKVTPLEKVELGLRHLDLIEDGLRYGGHFFNNLSYSNKQLEEKRNACGQLINTAVGRIAALRERLYDEGKQINPTFEYLSRGNLRPRRMEERNNGSQERRLQTDNYCPTIFNPTTRQVLTTMAQETGGKVYLAR
ncbi:MAG TPA: hypothetical protein VJI15_03885 [Candidatus Nanoarchaeia archaeon]|nr:hypothetical protein [Candidatus Nanoarchaeia archaeon]